VVEHFALPEILVCPACHGELASSAAGVSCVDCAASYPVAPEGFLMFTQGERDRSERLDSYARRQEADAPGFFERFLGPRIGLAERILDVGCGGGSIVAVARGQGLEAYGIDLPKAVALWSREGRDPASVFAADATSLPFGDRSFDLVTSFGVIEHIGTVTGQATLRSDYVRARRAFARELLRVVRPGGRILVSCPNKSFPVDLHHGPGDEVSPPRGLRGAISRATGLNVHPTWGRYHLLSHREVRDLFAPAPASALPLSGYFSFDGLRSRGMRALAPVAKAYVEHLPNQMRATAMNPFVLAEIQV
jgi:SAM-dependent methyltransferase